MHKRIATALLAVLIGLGTLGCGAEPSKSQAPVREDKPIMDFPTAEPTQDTVEQTPVYATSFGDTVFLATVPIESWQEREPDCDPREISLGGRICCGGEHEEETPTVKVVILEEIAPLSTSGWFRDMVCLTAIEGLEKLRMDSVTDMSYMFSGCVRLGSLEADGWDVSGVLDMTGIFDGCDSMTVKPVWYSSDGEMDS